MVTLDQFLSCPNRWCVYALFLGSPCLSYTSSDRMSLVPHGPSEEAGWDLQTDLYL